MNTCIMFKKYTFSFFFPYFCFCQLVLVFNSQWTLPEPMHVPFHRIRIRRIRRRALCHCPSCYRRLHSPLLPLALLMLLSPHSPFRDTAAILRAAPPSFAPPPMAAAAVAVTADTLRAPRAALAAAAAGVADAAVAATTIAAANDAIHASTDLVADTYVSRAKS